MENPFHRACASCRSLKTRCLPFAPNPAVCERCVRFGRQCVFLPVQKRKQRRKTDARVAELEQEMKELRAMVEPSGAGQVVSRAVEVEARAPSPDKIASHIMDPVDRGILSMDTARHLLDHYKTYMYGYYPVVHIAPTCTADELRRTRPILFLAILASAAGPEHPELAAKLDKLVLEEYANRTVLNSEKSLELVQALLVSSSWYQPPTQLNQFKYTEYVHMAAMMATDIGIASRPVHTLDAESHFDTASVEARRTFLAVLIKSIDTTISSRRPPTMRVTSYGRECLFFLEQSPDALPGDHILIAWTRLLMIADEIGSAFAFDDPGGMASIFDVKTQLMMDSFKRRLSEWRQAHPRFDRSVPLRMTYYAVRSYLCEIVLHVDHRPEDFRVPYRMSDMSLATDTIPVRASVEALTELADSSHALLDAFTSLEPHVARALPLGMFVRVSYGIFMLAKLSASATHGRSQLAPLIDETSLQAELYANKTLLHVRNAIGPNGCRLPAIFLNLMSQMRVWCVQPWQDGSSISSPETLESEPSAARHAALTGSFESNYRRFGNDELVSFAAAHGQLDQTVDISNTLAQLETAWSEETGGPNKSPEAWADGAETGPAWSNAVDALSFLDGQDFLEEDVMLAMDGVSMLPWSDKQHSAME